MNRAQFVYKYEHKARMLFYVLSHSEIQHHFFYNSFKTGSRNQSQSLLLQLKLGKERGVFERGNGLRDFKGIDDVLFPTLCDKIGCLDLLNTVLAT